MSQLQAAMQDIESPEAQHAHGWVSGWTSSLNGILHWTNTLTTTSCLGLLVVSGLHNVAICTLCPSLGDQSSGYYIDTQCVGVMADTSKNAD